MKTALLFVLVGAGVVISIYQAIGTVAFVSIIIAACGGVAWWVADQKAKARAAFQSLVIDTIEGRIRPVEYKPLNKDLDQNDLNREALLRSIQIVRESLEIALASRKRDTAESRMGVALEIWDEAKKLYEAELDAEIWSVIDTLVADAQRRFHTVLYLNVAHAHLEKAATLKTDRGRRKYFELARQILDEGIADPLASLNELHIARKSVQADLERRFLSPVEPPKPPPADKG